MLTSYSPVSFTPTFDFCPLSPTLSPTFEPQQYFSQSDLLTPPPSPPAQDDDIQDDDNFTCAQLNDPEKEISAELASQHSIYSQATQDGTHEFYLKKSVSNYSGVAGFQFLWNEICFWPSTILWNTLTKDVDTLFFMLVVNILVEKEGVSDWMYVKNRNTRSLRIPFEFIPMSFKSVLLFRKSPPSPDCTTVQFTLDRCSNFIPGSSNSSLGRLAIFRCIYVKNEK